ncbi:MAG: glycosyltransferase [Myxococcales bacterium]|nr:glycosyltransferase [Myxococcales bacterium]
MATRLLDDVASLVPLPGLTKGPRVDFTRGRGGSILILSMRQVADLVGYCALYEFEDLIVDTMGADLGALATLDGLQLPRLVYKFARYLSGSPRVAETLTPARGVPLPRAGYDLFLPVFNHPHELFTLQAVAGWRERSRFAACYLCEAWDGQLPNYLIELLRDFDHVFVGVASSVDAVRNVCGRPCTYLPMGVDALRFHPPGNPDLRPIDVCGIGRRSPVTHQALLRYAQEREIFYYYDTIQSGGVRGFTKGMSFRVSNAREHRILLGNILKRSRYFIANRAWADKPAHTLGKEEIAARFYEGAAAGALMIGEPPDTDDFRAQFGWEDAIFPTPFHAPDIAKLIAAIDADPARAARARRQSLAGALRQHDWVYRLRTILETAGVAPTREMLDRERKLGELAEKVLAS